MRGLLAVFLFSFALSLPASAQLLIPDGSLPTAGAGDVPLLVDLDGDGDLDAVVFETSLSLGLVLTNDGAGQFTPVVPIVPGPFPRQALAGDVDGDGDSEIITRDLATVTVFMNNSFNLVPQVIPAAFSLGNLELFDFENDGDLDLWFTSGFVMLNNAGAFAAPVQITFDPLQHEVHVFDLDADGDADFYECHGDPVFTDFRFWSVWRNDGAGNFVETLADVGMRYMNHGDVDGDGLVDFIFLHHGEDLSIPLESLLVWFGDGTGGVTATEGLSGYAEGVAFPLQRRPTPVDLTGDGADEIIVSHGFGIDVVVRNAPNQFGYHFGATSGIQHAVGDVDADGDVDVLITTSGGVNLFRTEPFFPHEIVVVSGDGQVTSVGRGADDPLVVQVNDVVTGQPVSGVAVQFTGEISGIVDQPMAMTDANGRAQTTLTAPPVIGGLYCIGVTADGADPTLTTPTFFARWLSVAWMPASGVLSVSFLNDTSGVPILLVADVPLPSPGVIETTFGPIFTSILAPGPFFRFRDGIGVFAAPDPVLVTNPFYSETSILGPTPTFGINAVFQVYGFDATLPFPDSFFTSNPVTVTF